MAAPKGPESNERWAQSPAAAPLIRAGTFSFVAQLLRSLEVYCISAKNYNSESFNLMCPGTGPSRPGQLEGSEPQSFNFQTSSCPPGTREVARPE